MNCHIIISLFVILYISSYSTAISYKRVQNGAPLATLSISTAVSSSEQESDSEESDEILEDGPEENPKCENSDQWPRLYPTCTGLQQSPINIKGSSVQMKPNPVAPLCWTNYDTIPETTSLFNAGHTIQMTGRWHENEEPSISCGILGNHVYKFVQWHCHWGKNNFNGSDHTFNGRPYPMECHFVHFRKDFGTFQNAALQKNGVAVVAYVFDVQKPDTFPFDVLGPAVLKLVNNDNITVMPVPLGVYGEPFTDNYVTYHGSLTTPPCSESVIWIINIKAQNISKSLIKRFRCVAQASECLRNNFRSVQEINGRDIILVPAKNILG